MLKIKGKKKKEPTEKNIGHKGTVFRSAICGKSHFQVIMQWAAGLLQNVSEGTKCFRKAIEKDSLK